MSPRRVRCANIPRKVMGKVILEDIGIVILEIVQYVPVEAPFGACNRL